MIIIKICIKNKGHYFWVFLEPHPISGIVLSTYLHYNPPKTFCSRYYYYPHFSEEVEARGSEPFAQDHTTRN